MADVGSNHRVARSVTVLHDALRAHVSTTACLLLLLLFCSPTSAFRPISSQLVSKLHASRHGSSAQMVPPRVAQLLAARRAERASAGGRGYYSRSASSAVRASSAAAPQASAADTAALTAIFTAARIPIPANQSNACTWYGVYCAADGGAVQRLYRNVYVTPSIQRPPPRTPRLCNSTARVPGRTFPATLSDSIGQLTGLVALGLQNLWLAGSVPQSFSRLTQISYLQMSSNCFAGPLPVAILSMPRLFDVSAAQNFFSGGLPQDPAAYVATSLQELDLGNNRLSGPIPAALATLPSLQGLLLNSNRLTGNIPPTLLKKESLDIIFDRNRLSGDLSGQQVKSSVFRVSGNRLSGNFNSIQFSAAVFIDVSDNLFSGSFPQILCRQGNQARTVFSRNRLTGAVPANCFNSETYPTDILLSGNNFSGSLQPFSNLPGFTRALDLGFNKFTGSIPQGLTRPELTYLDLRGNSLTGPIPAFCQGNHQAIRFLNLASNALSGPPTPLSSPSCSASLAYLNLSSNRLSGSIPATVSSFNRLKRLSLYSNALTGAIPAGVSKMKHLLTLRLSYNNLTGSIPAVWPKSIRQVLLAGNRLSGPVPAALSKLKRGSFKPGNDNLCGKPLPACA